MRFFLISISTSLLIGVLILLIISFVFELSKQDWISIGSGLLLALTYVLAGFFVFYRALNLKQKEFNIIFLSSIFIRLLMLAIILIVVFKFSDIDKKIFLISLFVWYFIFQLWEVISFNKAALKEI
jgi:hypothetical protein